MNIRIKENAVEIDPHNALVENRRHVAPAAGNFYEMSTGFDPFVVRVMGPCAEVAQIVNTFPEILPGSVFVEKPGITPAERKNKLH